jgi:hypothetical protein
MVLRVINSVLREIGTTPLDVLGELFSLARDNFLCTLPELDPYGTRDNIRYWGPNLADEHGVRIGWESGSRTRVFVRLTKNYVTTTELFKDIDDPGIDVIASLTGSIAGDLNRPPHLRVTNKRVQLSAVRDQCHFAVCHGDLGDVSSLLLAGVPLFLLPLRAEHRALAARLTDLGLSAQVPNGATVGSEEISGAKAHPDISLTQFERTMTGDTPLLDTIRSFSTRYATFSSTQQSSLISQRIQEIH